MKTRDTRWNTGQLPWKPKIMKTEAWHEHYLPHNKRGLPRRAGVGECKWNDCSLGQAASVPWLHGCAVLDGEQTNVSCRGFNSKSRQGAKSPSGEIPWCAAACVAAPCRVLQHTMNDSGATWVGLYCSWFHKTWFQKSWFPKIMIPENMISKIVMLKTMISENMIS